jgi:hypothetical protein
MQHHLSPLSAETLPPPRSAIRSLATLAPPRQLPKFGLTNAAGDSRVRVGIVACASNGSYPRMPSRLAEPRRRNGPGR